MHTTRAVLDALPDGVLVADANGTVLQANDMAAELLRTEGPLEGRRLLEVMALQDLHGCDWATVAAPYTGHPTRRLLVEQACRLADGTELLVTTRLVRRGRSGPVEQVGVSLRSARARSRLERERSDLVATIAHELRSPLTGVKGFTASLLGNWGRFTDDQKRLIMQSVHNDTDRLTRLIGELLDVARIDTGRLSLHVREVQLETVVDQVTASVFAGSARRIAVVLEPALPPILADPDRVAQVLTNLLENAIRHGAGEVRISAAERPGDGSVALVVEDQGEGIDAEIRRRVFTKFWKHGTRGGSGLGMYVVHGLVTAHGGTVDIGDAEGGGARIEVRWPTAAVTTGSPERVGAS